MSTHHMFATSYTESTIYLILRMLPLHMASREESSPTRRLQAGLPAPSQPRWSDLDKPPSPPASPCATPEALNHTASLDDQRNQHPGLSPTHSKSNTDTATTANNYPAQDESAGCGHPNHPAYADTYISPLCPWCQFHECLVLARTPALIITSRGGSEIWRNLIIPGLVGEAQEREQRLYKFVTGKRPRRDNQEQDLHVKIKGAGTEVSYPRGKIALLKKIADFEEIHDGEISWEKRNLQGLRGAETQQRLADAENYTARAALKFWHNTKKAFEKVEAQSAAAGLKRGREMEIATHPDFPPPDDYYPSRVYHLNQEQRSFIDAVTPPPPIPGPAANDNNNDNDEDTSPPKRKRRCLSASVAFNPHTYIRSEADIDRLFTPATALTPDFLEDMPAPPPPPPLQSILRTAPQLRRAPPQREFVVKALEIRDKCTAGTVARWRSRPPKEGYERVDTSGCGFKWRWEEWDAYREGLAVEAGEAGDGGVDVDEDEDMTADEYVDVEGVDESESFEEEGHNDGANEEDEFPTDEEVAEAERQIIEVQRTRNAPRCAKFRPHGGMASVLACLASWWEQLP